MIVARRNSVGGRPVPGRANGRDAAAFRQHVHQCSLPLRELPSGDFLAGPSSLGELRLRLSKRADMGAMFQSSVSIVIGVVPVSVLIATLAGFALGHLRVRGGQVAFVLFVLGLTLPFEGVIVPLYYEIRHLGLLGSRWAIILPLIGLFMPFGVYWMRAHFVNAPQRAFRGSSRRRGDHLAAVLAGARPSGTAGARVPWHLAVGLDLEPVPAVYRPRGQPDERDDGRSARCFSGPVGHQHPTSVGRVAAHPHADDHPCLSFSSAILLQHFCKDR